MLVVAGLVLAIASTDALAKKTTEISAADLERVRQNNAKCLECHSEDGMRTVERDDVDKQKLGALLVHPEVFQKSSHGVVECVACHVKGFTEFPHAEGKKKLVNWCDECHTRKFLRIEDQFFKSVHAKIADKKPDAFTCTTCHDPHVFIQESNFKQTRNAVRQDNDACLQCHGSNQRFAEISTETQPDLTKVHDWLPNNPLHWDAVRCVECHTPVPGKVFSHEILSADKAEKNCVSCHSVESSLRVRLYRHRVAEERETAGFLNSIILNEAYVIGATRNRYLDMSFGIIGAVVLAGIGLHGLGRMIAAVFRKRRDV